MNRIIYFNQKKLLLTDAKDAVATTLLKHANTVYCESLNDGQVKKMLSEMQKPETGNGLFLHTDLAELVHVFKQNMPVIQAGGGLVHTARKTILLIFRNGKWDLPKGKLDDGEAPDTAAVREVEEETGLKQIQLLAPLTTTYHTYYLNTELVLKETFWYAMQVQEEQPLTPQQEEGIEKCEWVSINELSLYLENMHPSIKDVLDVGLSSLLKY